VGADALTSLAWTFLGIGSGTLLNAVIWRIPSHERPDDISEAFDNEWFVREAARCEKCGALLSNWQSTGLLAVLVRKPTCPQCGRLLAVRRLLVELGSGILWLLSLRFFGPTLYASTVAIFASLLLGIAISDFRSWTIPHEFTWFGIVVGIVLSLFRGFPFISTIIGVSVGPAVFFVVGWLVAKYKKIPIAEALGLGDYWLIAMIGAFIGWKMVPVAIILSAVVGLVIALPGAVRAAVRRTESPKIPFGVFLALGGAVTLLVGDRLVSWYGHWALGR